ncbi:MAG: archaellin/type IV pilin N-terminal domain-containing protein [Candidatus Baldrarchaeia archaeon]
MQKYIFRRRRAISNVVAAALLIGIVVVAVALIWFLVAPMFTPRVGLTVYNVKIYDRDGDGNADEISFTIKNTGTMAIELDTTITYDSKTKETIEDSGINIKVGKRWATDCGATIQGEKRTIGPGEEVTVTVYISNDDEFDLDKGDAYDIYVGVKTTGTTYMFHFKAGTGW